MNPRLALPSPALDLPGLNLPQQSECELVKALLVYVPEQYQQHYRPFEMHATQADLNSLVEAAAIQGHNGVPQAFSMDSGALAGHASRILAPSAIPGAAVDIANGFGMERFAFFLLIKTTSVTGVRWEVVSGYTDKVDMTHGGYIDPNTVFYVNARHLIGGHTNGVAAIVQSDYGITNRTNHAFGSGTVLLRPADVASRLHAHALQGDSTEVFDDRQAMGARPGVDFQKNVIPHHYLAGVLGTYDQLIQERATLGSFDNESLHVDALRLLTPESLTGATYVRQLNLDGNGISSVDRFTFSQLNNRWPRDWESFWVRVVPRPGARMTSPVEHTQNWNNAAIETWLAYSISQSLIPIMTRLLIFKADFTCRNTGLDGRPIITYLQNPAAFFEQLMTPDRASVFLRSVMTEIIEAIVLQRVGMFDITVSVDLMGGCSINISIDGRSSIPYHAPTFCSHQFAPTVGGSLSGLSQIASAVDTVSEYLELARRSNENSNAVFSALSTPTFGSISPKQDVPPTINGGIASSTLPPI